MSDAHGSIKADPDTYRESTPALLYLAHALLEDGTILGNGSLVYAEDVKVGPGGEHRVVWMDIQGPNAIRRKAFSGEATAETILPGRLYLEISPTEHLDLHPLIHYQSSEVLDQVFYLNRGRSGKSGIQFLCYATGEFYLPGPQAIQLKQYGGSQGRTLRSCRILGEHTAR